MSTQNATAVDITGGTIVGITDLTVADGGTGRSTLTANAVLIGNGTSGINSVAPSTSGNVLTSDGTTWTSVAPAAYPLTSGTAVASTSGTSIDFTSIPSWVKRITVMFNGVSTNGSSNYLIQIGSGGVTTSGYNSTNYTSGNTGADSTAGFLLSAVNGDSVLSSGHSVITLLGSNIYVESSTISQYTTRLVMGGGTVTLGGVLDRVRITTVNGTDTFDAGSINILYE